MRRCSLTLQCMTCRLYVPIQYLNQCWFNIYCTAKENMKDILKYRFELSAITPTWMSSTIIECGIGQIDPTNLSTRRQGVYSQIKRFIWQKWGPPGSCRPQVGPMLAPWIWFQGCEWNCATHGCYLNIGGCIHNRGGGLVKLRSSISP